MIICTYFLAVEPTPINPQNPNLPSKCASPSLPVDVCSLPLDQGVGSSSLPRFYFDSDEKICMQFSFFGAGGNRNNFPTLEECRDECKGCLEKSFFSLFAVSPTLICPESTREVECFPYFSLLLASRSTHARRNRCRVPEPLCSAHRNRPATVHSRSASFPRFLEFRRRDTFCRVAGSS